MSGENIHQNENEQSLDEGIQSLADMPSFSEHMAENYEKSFDEARRDGTLPEGIRDEQDYQEYLAEYRAKSRETLDKTKERLNEKNEILSSFEKRIECNSSLYNEFAEEVAFLWNLMPDIYYYAYGGRVSLGGVDKRIRDDFGEYQQDFVQGWKGASTEEMDQYRLELDLAYTFRDANRMMGSLQAGVESKHPELDYILDKDSLPKPYGDFREKLNKLQRENPEEDLSGKKFLADGYGRSMGIKDIEDLDELYAKTENIIVPSNHQESFSYCLKGFFISKKQYEKRIHKYFSQEQIDEAHRKAHEIMDAGKWDEQFDELLKNKSLGTDEIKEANTLMSNLYHSTGDDTFSTSSGYSSSYEIPEFIPDMGAIYRLWGKINKTRDLISDSYRSLSEAYSRDNSTGANMRRLFSMAENY